MPSLIGWLLSLPVLAVASIVEVFWHMLISYWVWLGSACVVIHGTALAVRQLPGGRWPR